MALHQPRQCSQQALLVRHVQRKRHGVEVVVIVFFFLIVMRLALMHHLLHRAAHAQQQVHVHFVRLHAHHLHAGLGVGFDQCLHPGQRLLRQSIHLAEQHQVGHEELVFKQLGQGRFVVEVVVRAALRIHGLRVVGKTAIGHGGRIYHGYHGIYRKGVAQAWPLKCLHQRLGQRQAGGFDHQVVDLLAPRGQLLHNRREFFLHSAAQAAIGQFKQLAVIRVTFVAAQAAAAQQLAINAQLAKFVHDNGDALALRPRQYLAQQCGFARAQKAGHDGGGDFLQVHVCLL